MDTNKLMRDKFIAKRDVFSIGGAFRIMDEDGNLLLYSRQKLFKLKEDIRVFEDREMTREALHIQARSIIDFSAAYDVSDSLTREKVGALRRKGFKSLFRDYWEIMDKDDQFIVAIKEDSSFMAFIRRWFLKIIPQTYILETKDGKEIGKISQRFNIFVHKFDIDFSADHMKLLDRRLGIGAVILLLAIEGRQE
ncbi:hypothetical protein ACFL96_09550 [Thermoproteota archaeon]